MFVFGINLPVAEILFVVLLLFIVALIFIIVQLGKMARNIRVLDETTLEIRRYEEAEEVTLRNREVEEVTPAEKRRVLSFARSLQKAEAKVLKMLLDGKNEIEVRDALIENGVPESFATRMVNNASYWIDRFVSFKEGPKQFEESLKFKRV